MEVIIAGLLGLAVASFLNVCIDRLPAGQSLRYPPSHCPACQRRLAPKDLIPVVSYLWLRGRCRDCGARIPRRLLWVEIAAGVMSVLLVWQYGFTLKFAAAGFYFSVLTVILVIDLEQRLILNRVVYPAAAVSLAIAVLSGAAVKSLIGAAVGLGIMFVIALVFRGGMGWGDVKMAGMMGAMVYYPQILVALMLAVVGAGLVAIALLVLRLRRRKDVMPFGPFLSAATMATLLWGQAMLDWYLGLFP